MITEQVLVTAVAKDLITAGQAEVLRSLARQNAMPGREPQAEPDDEEKLRLVSGFADIFVTIGIALFLGSAVYLLEQYLGRAWVGAGIAVLAWILAEFFTRLRRMALPSIALLIAFAVASYLGLAGALDASPGPVQPSYGWLGTFVRTGADPLNLAVAGLGAAGLVALHYWRFQVPVTVAAGAAALGVTVLSLLASAAPNLTTQYINLVLLLLGLLVFALAMAFDLADPTRQTRRTDIAFWLHLLASPLIVHSLFAELGAARGSIEIGSALTVLLAFLALGLVAVLVDRRALLVSGLVYAGIAFGSLIERAGITDASLPYTVFALGAFVLLLSAGWTPLRGLILRHLPSGFASRLPHPTSP